MPGVLAQSSMVLAATLATATAAASLAMLLYRPKAHKTLPGPPGLPFLGNGLLLSQLAAAKELHKLWEQLDKEYGKIFAVSALGKLFVLVRDPNVAKAIFNNATDFVRDDAGQRAMR
jgi:hypothetical protein